MKYKTGQQWVDPDRPSPEHIYCLKDVDTNQLKIGMSFSPQNRRKALARGKRNLVLMGQTSEIDYYYGAGQYRSKARELELDILAIFRPFSLRDKEWHRPNPFVLRFGEYLRDRTPTGYEALLFAQSFEQNIESIVESWTTAQWPKPILTNAYAQHSAGSTQYV